MGAYNKSKAMEIINRIINTINISLNSLIFLTIIQYVMCGLGNHTRSTNLI